MKRMKRIMALMLAAIMMMAMSVTAFAAEGATGTHTLTVNVKSTTPAQDLKGQTINLYKLFDVTESKSGEPTRRAMFRYRHRDHDCFQWSTAFHHDR